MDLEPPPQEFIQKEIDSLESGFFGPKGIWNQAASKRVPLTLFCAIFHFLIMFVCLIIPEIVQKEFPEMPPSIEHGLYVIFWFGSLLMMPLGSLMMYVFGTGWLMLLTPLNSLLWGFCIAHLRAGWLAWRNGNMRSIQTLSPVDANSTAKLEYESQSNPEKTDE